MRVVGEKEMSKDQKWIYRFACIVFLEVCVFKEGVWGEIVMLNTSTTDFGSVDHAICIPIQSMRHIHDTRKHKNTPFILNTHAYQAQLSSLV